MEIKVCYDLFIQKLMEKEMINKCIDSQKAGEEAPS